MSLLLKALVKRAGYAKLGFDSGFTPRNSYSGGGGRGAPGGPSSLTSAAGTDFRAQGTGSGRSGMGGRGRGAGSLGGGQLSRQMRQPAAVGPASANPPSLPNDNKPPTDNKPNNTTPNSRPYNAAEQKLLDSMSWMRQGADNKSSQTAPKMPMLKSVDEIGSHFKDSNNRYDPKQGWVRNNNY